MSFSVEVNKNVEYAQKSFVGVRFKAVLWSIAIKHFGKEAKFDFVKLKLEFTSEN